MSFSFGRPKVGAPRETAPYIGARWLLGHDLAHMTARAEHLSGECQGIRR